MFFFQLVIELVLGTDMKNHFAIIGHFNTVHMLGSVTPMRISAGYSSNESVSLGYEASRRHVCYNID